MNTVEPIEQSTTAWRIKKRLTPALVKAGFTAVPTAFLVYHHALDVTSAEAMAIVHLLSYKWTEKNPYPRLGVLAKKMGLTKTSVRSHTRKLEEKKLLKRVARAGHSNEFDLTPLFVKLESLLASAPKKTAYSWRRENEKNLW